MNETGLLQWTSWENWSVIFTGVKGGTGYLDSAICAQKPSCPLSPQHLNLSVDLACPLVPVHCRLQALVHLLQQVALQLHNNVSLLPAIHICSTERHLITHLGCTLLAGSVAPVHVLYICTAMMRFSTSTNVKSAATSGLFTSCTAVNSCDTQPIKCKMTAKVESWSLLHARWFCVI